MTQAIQTIYRPCTYYLQTIQYTDYIKNKQYTLSASVCGSANNNNVHHVYIVDVTQGVITIWRNKSSYGIVDDVMRVMA